VLTFLDYGSSSSLLQRSKTDISLLISQVSIPLGSWWNSGKPYINSNRYADDTDNEICQRPILLQSCLEKMFLDALDEIQVEEDVDADEYDSFETGMHLFTTNKPGIY
jgi:hypothetical protein